MFFLSRLCGTIIWQKIGKVIGKYRVKVTGLFLMGYCVLAYLLSSWIYVTIVITKFVENGV
ncbi:TPA: hypothetical protein DHW51_01275 [Candidatus Poribacteria bacterium]|nr:hypothetical protein [Candidatus Poribacteria bacterium]